MTLKTTPELLALIGAADESEASDKLVSFLASLSTKAEVTAIDGRFKDFATVDAVKAVDKRADGIEAAVEALPDADKVKAIASTTAASVLGKVGAGSVPAAAAPAAELPEKTDKKDFNAIVADNVKGGMSKGAAIQAAIKSNPAEYAEARATGNFKI